MEVPLDVWNFESHLEEFLPLHGKVLALPPQPCCPQQPPLPGPVLGGGPQWAEGRRDLGQELPKGLPQIKSWTIEDPRADSSSSKKGQMICLKPSFPPAPQYIPYGMQWNVSAPSGIFILLA